MSTNFDDILASGDDEAIAAALEEMDVTGELLFDEDSDEVVVNTPEVKNEAVEDPKAEENDEADTKVEATDSSPDDAKKNQLGVKEIDGKLYAEIDENNAVIQSKDGKHHVPYDVLANARQAAQQAKQQLEAEREANAKIQADFAETKRVAELYSKQLDEAGLDPKVLPEQMLNDPALMAQIKEDYPQLGDLVEALASKIAVNTEQPTNTADPLVDALSKTEHLKVWQQNDVDKWELAAKIDEKLADDPAYTNKPLSERLAEVEKRVMLAFDELSNVDEKPTPAANVSAPIPNSPSDVGSQTDDSNAFAHILEQDAGAMTAQMQSMTEQQIESLLMDASDFL